jgi:MFS family permease
MPAPVDPKAVSGPSGRNPAWAVFGHRDFRALLGARWLAMFALQAQNVAIGWQVYAITHRPLALAWVGLAQFFPAILLSLVTGHVADRFDRRRILQVCHAAMAALSLALVGVASAAREHVALVYLVLVGIGVARAFAGPATQSIMPSLVPLDQFRNAVAWASSSAQAAMVIGPTAGGIVYGVAGGPSAVYAASAACSLGALILVSAIRHRPPPTTRLETTAKSVLMGLRYVRGNPIVLGAISLDLFAVLLGGATALLPIYAQDILHLGPWALGALRGAPAVGSAATGFYLAVRPIERRVGAKMLGCVAAFGVATIVFGVSRVFALSLASLALSGAADMISVFVRTALVQLATPDEMRGRVSAVNMVAIGASNELGEFESGLTAQWLGAEGSVVVGGVGTLLVVALWAWRFPALRRVDRLNDVIAGA